MSLLPPKNRFDALYTDLAAARLGGETLNCTDDFFAEMANLLKPGRAVFIEDKYTDRGKWMDGWESRRRRFRPDGTTSDGRDHDTCTIKLGAQGIIHGINIDTHHFKGNAPQKVSIDACESSPPPDDNMKWTEILPTTEIQPDCENLFDIASDKVWSHVKLHIYPDGGVARFRVYGDIAPDWSSVSEGELIDLAAIRNGARPLVCSDMFFSDMENLLMPGRGINMGDGWETKRRRLIGNVLEDRANDWLILKLAATGYIRKAVVDTCHFKGNYPDGVTLEGAVLSEEQAENLALLAKEAHENALFESDKNETIPWLPILDFTQLDADQEHHFENALHNTDKPFTHVRVKMYPDGGISRLRLWGTV